MRPCFVFVLLLALGYTANANLKPQCLGNTKYHKNEPGKEEFLHGECKSWRSLSCCTINTTASFHTIEAWRGFDRNHCAQLSDQCRTYFNKELCLYECDPFLSQWIVTDDPKKGRTERFYQIPLCKKDCDSWFNACQDDYTCRDNWHAGFLWINKTNYCPEKSKCQTFRDTFKTAKNFCSQIWDDAFTVSDDEQNCIKFDLDANEPNPNEAVASRLVGDVYGHDSSNGTGFARFDLNFLLVAVLFCYVFVQ